MTQVLHREMVGLEENSAGLTLTRYEEASWNEITTRLGAVAFSETPIWDGMIAKFPYLDLYSRPVAALADRRDYVRDPADMAFYEDKDYGVLTDAGLIERVLAGLRNL